jgi:hypothetical protein
MATRKLSKDEWQAYADRVSKGLRTMQAELEVGSLELGQQIETDWVPFYGIAYDPRENQFEIAVEGVDHLIGDAAEVYVEEGASGLESLEIVDTDDTHQILRLREALELPAPS